MNPLQLIFLFLGRLCLSAIFIMSSIGKVRDWQGTIAFFTNGMADARQIPELTPLLDMMASQPILFLVAGTFFEFFGGVLVLLGMKVRLGALMLMLFLIPTTLIFHHFWILEGADRNLQMIMFLKNLSIFGGLMILFAFGKGKFKPKPISKE